MDEVSHNDRKVSNMDVVNADYAWSKYRPSAGLEPRESHAEKKPELESNSGFSNKSLTMTYSHMGKPHTTIGDVSFHF